MAKHSKHTKLARRFNGNYASNEIAFLGVKCSIITDLVQKVAKNLEKSSKISYLDASHNDELSQPILDTFTFHKSGNLDVNAHQDLNPYNARIQFSNYDLLCINGNHYQGQKQVLILDDEKEKSVLKRLDQLTDIQFVIKMKEDSKYFDFLEEKHPKIKNLKCYLIDEVEKISTHINALIQEQIAPVQALILTGGKSTRMGMDKSQLNYHGKPQATYLYDVLSKIFLHYNESQKGVYLSVREGENIEENFIEDKFKDLGPFGGICSAFMENPNTAWFTIATDVPYVNIKMIHALLKHRNPKKIATTFKGKDSEFPEPLITIWEPKAYPILLNYLSQGYSCPRKVLINSEVEIVEVDNYYIQNVNTPSEYEKAKEELKK